MSRASLPPPERGGRARRERARRTAHGGARHGGGVGRAHHSAEPILREDRTNPSRRPDLSATYCRHVVIMRSHHHRLLVLRHHRLLVLRRKRSARRPRRMMVVIVMLRPRTGWRPTTRAGQEHEHVQLLLPQGNAMQCNVMICNVMQCNAM